jgi:3-hydroxyacyl-[acyl-carrier-protein] dehydratase
MLLNDFYKILSVEPISGSQHVATILINEKHIVFKGHFPDNPIMPGVCMMQIIKELTEQITESSLVMQKLIDVKFTALINPFLTPELKLELEISTTEEGLVKVKNTSYFNDTVALKLSCLYKKAAK